MDQQHEAFVRQATGAQAVRGVEPIQSLWSGYGELLRCHLAYSDGDGPASVVLKHVRAPQSRRHPRGWNTDRSHQRKLTSYRVEAHWYGHWAARCDARCRVPQALAARTDGDDTLILLEDLDAAGYDQRRSSASLEELGPCIQWLAHFHATFLHESPDGLWPTGTYWHLATRPDELEQLDDARLQAAASAIDTALAQSRFQTFVHGDAKLANFCFARDGRVAAVDFQYVGGGCGMKDLAYLVSSALDETQCEQHEAALLDAYFGALTEALAARRPGVDVAALERDWRALYPVAWTDFLRFLRGWSPGHWKIHGYSRRLAEQVLRRLGH